MPSPAPSPRSTTLIALLSCIAVVAILYFAKDVLVPVALAILLTFILAPLVNRLERLRLGRILSILVVVVLAGLLLAGISAVVFVQVTRMADEVPRYAENIKQKVKTFMPGPGSVIDKVTRAAGTVNESIEKAAEEVAVENGATQPSEGAMTGDSSEPEPKPVPVQVKEPETTARQVFDTARPALTFIATGAIVTVLVIFMLYERKTLRDRMAMLSGRSRISITTVALEEAGRRISRYLLMQLLINTLYGVPVGIGLWLIGVPNAFLWGFIALTVRFIPYVGPWIGALPPIVLSLAIFDSWYRPSLVIGMFIVLELIVNNVLEPWLYGSGAGVAPLPLLVSTLFWTWLWGPVGLVLAVPMTVCVAVLARYVPHLSFLNALLTDRPQLEDDAKFHQRVLSLDFDDAFEVAQSYCDEHNLMETHERLVLPSVRRVESARHAGTIDDDRVRAIRDGLHLLIDELAECAELSVAGANGNNGAAEPEVLCVPASDHGDEVVGQMLCQLLQERSIAARMLRSGMLVSETVEAVKSAEIAAVCVSVLPPSTIAEARHLCKRLLASTSDCPIILGVWGTGGVERKTRRLPKSERIHVVSTLGDAVKAVNSCLRASKTTATAAA